MTKIDEITEIYYRKYVNSLSNRTNLDLYSIIFQAVQAGMAAAYLRGIEEGKKIK